MHSETELYKKNETQKENKMTKKRLVMRSHVYKILGKWKFKGNAAARLWAAVRIGKFAFHGANASGTLHHARHSSRAGFNDCRANPLYLFIAGFAHFRRRRDTVECRPGKYIALQAGAFLGIVEKRDVVQPFENEAHYTYLSI